MILNNKLLRILQNALRDTPVVKLYANFNTLTLPELPTKFWNLSITVFITKTNCHLYFQIILARIIWSIHTTPAPESIFILNIHTVPWGRDPLNLKEVVYGIHSQMNSSLISAQSFAKRLKKFMIDKSLVPL